NLISGAIASMSPSEVAKEMERAYIRDVYDGTTIFDPEIYQLMPSLVGLDNEVVFTVHPNYTPTSIGFSTSVVLANAEITTNTPSIDNENTGDFIHETWQHETTRNLDYYGVHNAVDMAKADDLYDLTVIAIRRGLNYSPGYYVNGVENDGYVTYGIFINATAGLNAVALLAAFTASLHPLD
ncbi:MAG: hypothetical protein KAH32_06065, partial [Chlamydiia bacterium]|nr:hypothetical protein [Chlamydiia bacterium]